MVSPIDVGCDYCHAAPSKSCVDKLGRVIVSGPHYPRIQKALNTEAQQEGTTVSQPVPSTPVAAPAVDVPLSEDEIGAKLSNPDEYNGPEEVAQSEADEMPRDFDPGPEPDDSPTTPVLGPDGTNSPAEMSAEDRQKQVTKVYGETVAWIREKYRDEFNARMVSTLAERGISWSPKPNKAEAAKAKARKALEDAGLEVPEELR